MWGRDSTCPTQEMRAAVGDADGAAPTREHELGHTDVRNLSTLRGRFRS